MLLRFTQVHSGKAVFQIDVFLFFCVIYGSGLEEWLWAVQRAHDTAESLSLSVPSYEWPATC